MAQPVTTTELLLAQVVDLLTEVRDLLQQAPAEPAAAPPPADTSAKPASRTQRKHATKTRT